MYLRVQTERTRRTAHSALCLVVLAVLLLADYSIAQVQWGAFPDTLPPDRLALVRLALAEGRLAEVPGLVFQGKSFDPTLAQLVVYFPKDRGRARAEIVRDGKRVDDLRGKRHVWVMVYSDSTLEPTVETTRVESTLVVHVSRTGAKAAKSGAIADSSDTLIIVRTKSRLLGSTLPADTSWTRVRDSHGKDFDRYAKWSRPTRSIRRDSLLVRHTTLAFERDPAEASLLGLLEKVLSAVKPAEDPAPKGEDKEAKVALSRISPADAVPLYHVMQKVPIDRKTVNRVTVRLGEHRTQATFGNYSASPLGASVGVLTTIAHGGDSPVGGTTVAPAGFFHIYARRPAAPSGYRPRFLAAGSLSVVVGTQIKSDIDNGFAGVCFGHMFSNASLVIGTNLRSSETTTVNPKREWKGAFAIGLTYVL